jgi:hypothetical protein
MKQYGLLQLLFRQLSLSGTELEEKGLNHIQGLKMYLEYMKRKYCNYIRTARFIMFSVITNI